MKEFGGNGCELNLRATIAGAEAISERLRRGFESFDRQLQSNLREMDQRFRIPTMFEQFKKLSR